MIDGAIVVLSVNDDASATVQISETAVGNPVAFIALIADFLRASARALEMDDGELWCAVEAARRSTTTCVRTVARHGH